MKQLFDTTAYSALLRGNERVAETLNGATEILIPSVVVAELRCGFVLDTKRHENGKLLNRFVANKKAHVLLPDNATTEYFVNIAVLAQKKGA